MHYIQVQHTTVKTAAPALLFAVLHVLAPAHGAQAAPLRQRLGISAAHESTHMQCGTINTKQTQRQLLN
jgi:hypothetical protein